MNDTLVALPNGDFRVLGQGGSAASDAGQERSSRATGKAPPEFVSGLQNEGEDADSSDCGASKSALD